MYHVIHKVTGVEKTLEYHEVNDMFSDALGRIIVCGTDEELYWLLADLETISE